jgi:hypothetical protein
VPPLQTTTTYKQRKGRVGRLFLADNGTLQLLQLLPPSPRRHAAQTKVLLSIADFLERAFGELLTQTTLNICLLLLARSGSRLVAQSS